jgi:hypothetical protein
MGNIHVQNKNDGNPGFMDRWRARFGGKDSYSISENTPYCEAAKREV